MQPNQLAELITPTAAALRAGVSPLTVAHWFDRGHVAGVRTGLGRLIDATDLERLMAERNAAKPAPGVGA
jgi:hypothetical protein